MANHAAATSSQRVFVVTTTHYPDASASNARFTLALELCRLAWSLDLRLIAVDDSPDHEHVRAKLVEAGTAEFVHVFRQEKPAFSGKGGALRQAIGHAVEAMGEDESDCCICFTEPEKVDLLHHVAAIAKPILDGVVDVVVPERSEEFFRRTYPIEQYHSESFGNRHFDLLARRCEGFRSEGMPPPKLDWLFGPFAFRAFLADRWLGYGGASWDAQMVPYVRGVRDEGWRIAAVTVDFCHPASMKEQEEGDPAWTEKRLRQLNLLFRVLGGELLATNNGITTIRPT